MVSVMDSLMESSPNGESPLLPRHCDLSQAQSGFGIGLSRFRIARGVAMIELKFLISLLLFCKIRHFANSQSVSLCSLESGRVLPGQCRPLVKCVRFESEVAELRNKPCRLAQDTTGVCCPHIVLNRGRPRVQGVLRPPPRPRVILPPVRQTDLRSALQSSVQATNQRALIEQALIRAGLSLQSRVVVNRPVIKHRRLQRTKISTREKAKKAQKLVDASNSLAQTLALSPEQGTHGLPSLELRGVVFDTSSGRDAFCDTDNINNECNTADPKYRLADGLCNNVNHPKWGSTNAALQRILHPAYQDGISEPRGGLMAETSLLPSARSISVDVVGDQNLPSPRYTLLVMQFGQFLDHDLVHTPMARGENDAEIQCCSSSGTLLPISSNLLHPECFPIFIKDGLQNGRSCMELVRSVPAEPSDCKLGPRQQVNQITSFLDASNIYGSELSTTRQLRLGRGGRLRVTRFNNNDLLPLDAEECADRINQKYCFLAGDERVNEQPQLTVMHTLWHREHNRIAQNLALLNPFWDDEKLFQEARRIVVAQLQHITYNEWLPIILGNDYVEKNGLVADNKYVYDPNVDASVTNAFATAAFRFGHSLVQGLMGSFNELGNSVKMLRLHRHQLLPFEIYEQNSIDDLARGLASQPMQSMDASFSNELTRHLFQTSNSSFGLDLVALNIQRGRDHGLPPYSAYRRLCNLPPINSWRDLSSVVREPQLVPRLQRLYAKVEDVDLFVGGVLEREESQGILGPTFQCLVGDQFKRLKLGDRFWYENNRGPQAFTQAQLASIRESSMARVLCDNALNIGRLQPLAFEKPQGLNERVDCSSGSIPRVDLSPWRQ